LRGQIIHVEEFAFARENVSPMLKFAGTLLFAALLFGAPGFAVPTVSAHTSVVVFDAKSMHVTERLNGYCWTGSIASERSDAFRCMTGNSIHDPCFTLSPREVACPTSAEKNEGVVISLTKPLPPANQSSSVWRMQLESGAECNVGTGTTIPGYPFYCTGALVCSAPPPGRAQNAVFVHCATLTDGKLSTPGSFLVRTLFE
jgi:hypothetical protein